MAQPVHSTQQKQEPARKREAKPTVQQEPADLAQLQRTVLDPGGALPADILALQHTAGNRAVSHLIQTKLMVGPAGDQYEQEADRIAEQVMSRPAAAASPPRVQRQNEEEEQLHAKPLAASITPLTRRSIRREEGEEEVQGKTLVHRQGEEGEIQAKSGDSFEVDPRMESSLAAGRGSGQPLASEVRGLMEGRFGADFSAVRVHAGPEAAGMSRRIQAQAFTHGSDIYVGAGRYEPGTSAGKRLLAHELTHVVQQGKAGVRTKRAGAIARRPAEAIQRNGKLETLKQVPSKIGGGIGSAAQTVGGGLSTAGHAIGGAAQTVGSGIHDYSIAGAYTAKEKIGSAAETVGGGLSTAGRAIGGAAQTVGSGIRDYSIAGAYTAKEKVSSAGHAVADWTTEKATAVKNKLYGVHVGLRDMAEPMVPPTSLNTTGEGHGYAGKLLYKLDQHVHETKRNQLFLEQDEFEIEQQGQDSTNAVKDKTTAQAKATEPKVKMGGLRKSAAEQKEKLQKQIDNLNKYKAELDAEKPIAAGRSESSRAAVAELLRYQADAYVHYDTILKAYRVAGAGSPLSGAVRGQIAQLDRLEEASRIVRNRIAADTNVVRKSGRSERLFTYGLVKLIGGKIANIALQTATLTVLGVESKDRPGGYSSTIKITSIKTRLKNEFNRLKGIVSSNLYGNKHASRLYVLLKGLSTLIIQPLRDLAGSISLLSTLLGLIIGPATMGAAAPIFAKISTFAGYAAAGLSALNAIVNAGLAVWNAIRLKFLVNQHKHARLAHERGATTSTAITESLTAAAAGAGVGAGYGMMSGAFSPQAGLTYISGGIVPTSGIGESLLKGAVALGKTGVEKGIGIPAAAVPGVVADKLSLGAVGWKEAHEKGTMAGAYRPHAAHGPLIGTHYKVGVPHPKFAQEAGRDIRDISIAGAYTAKQRAGEAAEAIGGGIATAGRAVGGAAQTAGREVRDISIAGAYTAKQNIEGAAETAGGAIASGARWTRGKVEAGATRALDAGTELKNWSEKELTAARKWMGSRITELVTRFGSFVSDIPKKVGKVIDRIKSIKTFASNLKAKLLSLVKKGKDEEDAIEMTTFSQEMEPMSETGIGPLPETVGDALKWASEQSKVLD